MTIAACYVSSEGVVFGADSTATFLGTGMLDGAIHTYDFCQKVFEIGDSGSTLGFVSCGPQGIGDRSFRTMLAELSDSFISHPPGTVADAVHAWRDRLWGAFTYHFSYPIQRYQDLQSKGNLTKEEKDERSGILQMLSGTCVIGGRVSTARIPSAYAFSYGPRCTEAPRCVAVPRGIARFWGCPNLLHRLQFGMEDKMFEDIKSSPHWTGTEQDLINLLTPHLLEAPGEFPIRDAIDWIYSSIFITIKAMKFSKQPSICGGPIEVAVITTDRPFRWVRHKSLLDAITLPGA